ncbi:MAG: hypothetical protein JST61_07205 [Acidobacteria bacterium]|nr:hypothetical protein [Acidobacteriota bacterium]
MHFSASQRNCAFLRYVVSETLAGRSEEIKERILGKELFGRPITYDTGSDAVVRVRANEVRKRLGCYYDEHESQAGWRIQLPIRTYVPTFLRDAIETPAEILPVAKDVADAPPLEQNTLSLSQMMIPTLIALFLCAATFRWHVFSGTPYLDFWETLLSGHTGVALILDADPADPHAVTTDDLRTVSPILQAVASFHASTQVRSDVPTHQEDQFVPIHITHRTPQPGDSQSAYVTVIPGSHAELWVGSNNLSALEHAINSMSDADVFPPALEVAIRRKTPSRLRIAKNEQITTQSLSGKGDIWKY